LIQSTPSLYYNAPMKEVTIELGFGSIYHSVNQLSGDTQRNLMLNPPRRITLQLE